MGGVSLNDSLLNRRGRGELERPEWVESVGELEGTVFMCRVRGLATGCGVEEEALAVFERPAGCGFLSLQSARVCVCVREGEREKDE